jgi:hypothetical protein
MLGARTTHFAGTLPGRFTAYRVRRGTNQKNEREATVQNVVDAILLVRVKMGHDADSPVVVLGAAGYIGRGVVERLGEVGVTTCSVDKLDRYTKPSCPHLLVNITTPDAINEYLSGEFIDGNTTVLNEVYPQPHPDIVEEIRQLGAGLYHISGVKAYVVPPFPKEYNGAVPCCAALAEERYEVVVTVL